MKARNRGRVDRCEMDRHEANGGVCEFSNVDPKLTEIDGSNHGSVFRHSSTDHVRPRLSPVYLDYAFIRVSHSATTHWTNIYGVRTVRRILRRPSDEMFRSIITAWACAEHVQGAAGYGKGDSHDTKTATPEIMPFRWFSRRRRRLSLPADNAKVFAQVTMHLERGRGGETGGRIDGISIGWV